MLSLATSKGLFLCAPSACTLGFGSLNHGLWPLKKGIWDPKSEVTNVKGTNLKSFH